MIEFVKETLLLLPFLFATYLALETLEARAGGALGKALERASSIGPAVGALAGAIPQCGVSAAAASLYAGGVVSVGTLLAVFLSTSDELIPVLLSERVPVVLLAKIVGIKAAAALGVGF
ncbi:MAG: arsenic efflux protein, partial [Kiritimatiellae bacterium]|nr:arsenic efflux protein [Kiritimatiellia bacterium]